MSDVLVQIIRSPLHTPVRISVPAQRNTKQTLSQAGKSAVTRLLIPLRGHTEQQVPITTPPHFPSRECCTGCRQQCRSCHVLEIFRDTQSPSFVTQHRLCLRCCSALAGADSCTRHWQSFGASRPDPQLLSRGCICPRAQLQLIYLSLKLPKLNCICQKAFSACRSPAVFGNPRLTPGVCVG